MPKVKRSRRRYDFRTREGKRDRIDIAILLLTKDLERHKDYVANRLREINSILNPTKRKKK